MVSCPKCGSDQITANNKGFSGGKAVAGALLTGGVGLLAGLHGSKKIIITCLACGHNFKPGEGKSKQDIKSSTFKETSYSENASSSKFEGTVNGNNAVVCSFCNALNPLFYIKCKDCKRVLTSSDNRVYEPNIDLKKKTNSGCAGVFILLIALASIFTYLVF